MKIMPYYPKTLQKILILGLFFSLISVYQGELGDLPYAILLIAVGLIFIGLSINYSTGRVINFGLDFKNCNFGLLDKLSSKALIFIWIGIVFSWGYGAALGLINLVPASLVFRNFFGLLLYFLFPIFLLLRPPKKDLLVTIFFAGLVQAGYGMHAFFIALLENHFLFINNVELSGLRTFYSTGLITIFPLFVISFAQFVLPKNKFIDDTNSPILGKARSFTFLIIFLFSLTFPTMSKGFILATFMLIAFICIAATYYFIGTGRINICKAFFLIFIIFLFFCIFITYYELITFSYSVAESSNLTRSEQYEYLISEISWLGHGLGSSLSSGYIRDDGGYGMELTYLNVVHKLGVFSLFLFASYVLTVMISINRIFKGVNVFESIFVLGLMGYLVVGAGNPILLSATAVTLHSIGMYVLVKPFLRKL